jgi:hypothetical protein
MSRRGNCHDNAAADEGCLPNSGLFNQLVHQSWEVQMRKFEIRFLDPGVEASAFTFDLTACAVEGAHCWTLKHVKVLMVV